MPDKKMLVKFENKSNRVKGMSFHSRRPWILASLHNGVIQLWDYRMEVLIEQFEEHDGPVRGVHFHISQPLFVSGGDDYKIKVWNYQLKRCLFNLLGHLDYIRTVRFHQTYPWVLSASDDQTIRIWNWQSRSCLSVLTGHNHYVMCAQFHPKDDLVLSASLDQTVRVWDTSGLRKKTVSITNEGFGTSSYPPSDLFGGSDVVVKHVLEGHSRGVNWASFHSTLSLIASGADDREVKLWRMNDAKAWEVDTMRGHINNVSSVLFHPKKELIISNSEDKSIRVWDIGKQAPAMVFRRENDRYWILDAHPTLNLLGAGHDSGLVIFKLSRERPAYAISENKTLYYANESFVYEYNFKTGKEQPIISTRRGRSNSMSLRNGGYNNSPKTLSYNTSNRTQHNILLCSDADSSYELYIVQKGSQSDEVSSALRGYAKTAVFTSRNRFAVLDKSRQIWMKNLKNETRRRITIPNVFVNHIFSGGIGRLLCRTSDSIILYDIQSLKVVEELPIQSRHPIKYVVWSSDNKFVALFSKASIYIANSKLQELCTINENNRIKSGAWDPIGVFVYTTTTHLKYVVPNGDNGIIRSLEVPVYVTMVNSTTLSYLNRETKLCKMAIDTTEYQFKVALMKRKNREVLRIMKSKKLVGQAIIGYLQQKGFPEVALHFVEDPTVKFSLALECGNIGVALQCAAQLDKADCWHKLGVEALRQGNHQVVEAAYQKTKNFARLSFLYLITGNTEKLVKMLHIAGLRNDLMSRYHNALYLGNVNERIQILQDVGQYRLAYVTAKAHRMDKEADAIAEKLGDNIPELPDLSACKLLMPPNPILRESNWPLIEVRKGFFDQMNDAEDGGDEPIEDEPNDMNQGADSDADIDGGWGGSQDGKEDKVNDDDEEAGGWGEDLDLGDEFEDTKHNEKEDGEDDDIFIMPRHGKSVFSKWNSNSTLAADMIAAGSFDLAMHLLNRQIGITNFEPLKPMFISIYNASHCILPQLPGTDNLVSPLSRSNDEDKELPLLGFNIQQCVDTLKKGYKAVRDGKVQAGYDCFLEIIQTLPLVVVGKKAQVQEVYELRDICREYITAMRIEILRRATKDKTRQAQLAAYFTHCELQPIHLILALRVAIRSNYGVKNYRTTASFCRRIFELSVSTNQQAISKLVPLKQIRSVLKLCEKENTEAVKIDFDESVPFNICCETFTALYKGDPIAHCPYCGSVYKDAYDGTLCRTCKFSKIGSQTSGLTCFVDPSKNREHSYTLG